MMNINSRNRRRHPWLIVVAGAVVLSLLSLALDMTNPGLSEAQSALPPRETPIPPPPEAPKDKKRENDQPSGAHIELQVQAAPAGAWSGVQWRDSAANWHDVDGWQGTLSAAGYERWWVAAKDFSSGPFRWIVKSGPTGPVIGISEPFSLPPGPNQTVRVVIPVRS